MHGRPDAVSGAIPSREDAFLDAIERRAKRWRKVGPVAAMVGVLLLVSQWLGSAGNLIGGVSVIVGLGFGWLGVSWLTVLTQARESLTEPVHEARLEVRIRRGYAFRRYTTAWLWPIDSTDHTLAQFSSMHWPDPRFMTSNKTLAQVHGAPIAGAVVVVSCSAGLVVGRIGRSHFGEDTQPKPLPPIMRWLMKERTLR